jgi:hypothetical protein
MARLTFSVLKEIMITFGQVSSQFILGDLVTFMEGSTGKDELHVVTLIDQFNHRYTVTVKADCNYVVRSFKLLLERIYSNL